MVNQGCGAQCRLAPEGGNHPEWPTSYPATFDLSPFGSQFLRENLAQTTGRPDDRATGRPGDQTWGASASDDEISPAVPASTRRTIPVDRPQDPAHPVDHNAFR